MGRTYNNLNLVTKRLSECSSFPELHRLLFSHRLPLRVKYDFGEMEDKVEEYRNLLDKITSIIFSPHIKVSTNPVILRSEQSGRLSQESFRETVKDLKLWRRKHGRMAPEYVHNEESIDTIENYENQFICLLVNEIEADLKDIKDYLLFLNDSIEGYYQRKQVNFGPNSIFDSFREKRFPYNGIFIVNDLSIRNVNSITSRLSRKLKNIKGSEFYRLNSKKPISRNVLPTNVLIHDELYGYCYRYYKQNFLMKKKSEAPMDVLYYNFFIGSLFAYLDSSGLLEADKQIYFKLDEDSQRLYFGKFSFDRKGFHYFIKQDEDNLGIQIEVTYKRSMKARYYVLTSFDYEKDNKKMVDDTLALIGKDYDGIYLACFNNHTHDYDRKFPLSLFHKKAEVERQFANLFISTAYCFEADMLIYKEKCPVCGQTSVISRGDGYGCMDCGSEYYIYKGRKNTTLWIKSYRRRQ